ncbi:hypothetical protein LVD15_13135 [Fulvivirga maritima]|uniref:hypothetical protein n=1 Tax=Fulvivirga maritima TaxID=2904247 RepID=UPI001F47ED32|nr:hypothetical protein [Fulvivirga maritima]UII29330.1 hypothetical protein LVD15_13135 [Fulvivirga maritima]
MRILPLGLILIFIVACNSSKKPDEAAFLEGLDSAEVEGPAISEEVISSIIQQIPSPLEISVLLKESGTKYDRSILNSPDNISKYNSNYQKSLNLGIYGTDLGYTNIYEQNQDGIEYMSSIKELAESLSIGQFFDIETIGRLATNSKNLDSLLLITTQNFNSINKYLQDQNRANLSVLSLTGGWLEAMHITCQVYAKNPDNKDLRETIGEQKIILDNVVQLLSFYEQKDPNMASLLGEMRELQKVYESVEIVKTYKESTFEIVDGVMVIKDNSTSEIKITNENVETISNLVSSIRKNIIS